MLKSIGYSTAIFGKWHLGSLDADKVPGQVPTDVRDGMDGPLAVVTPRMMGYDEFLSTPGCGSATNPNCGCVDESMASCVTGHYGHSTDSGRTRGLMVIPCGQYFRQRANESRPAPWAGRSPDDDADFLFGAFAAFAEGSTFRKADLSFADLEQGNFEDSDFTDAVLEGAQVSAARFERAVIENSDWTDVVLRKDVQQFLCRKPSAKGTNPVTGADTRESLMC